MLPLAGHRSYVFWVSFFHATEKEEDKTLVRGGEIERLLQGGPSYSYEKKQYTAVYLVFRNLWASARLKLF